MKRYRFQVIVFSATKQHRLWNGHVSRCFVLLPLVVRFYPVSRPSCTISAHAQNNWGLRKKWRRCAGLASCLSGGGGEILSDFPVGTKSSSGCFSRLSSSELCSIIMLLSLGCRRHWDTNNYIWIKALIIHKVCLKLYFTGLTGFIPWGSNSKHTVSKQPLYNIGMFKRSQHMTIWDRKIKFIYRNIAIKLKRSRQTCHSKHTSTLMPLKIQKT